MKVIHIAGFSNTGKTTFIRELLPELEKLGPTGVVKHIGHHGHPLPEGKDTTLFHEAGAAASVGIDAQKSVLILKETDLERVLELLCDEGMQYAVVEGFKKKTYPKVAIGNVQGASNVILQDPTVEDVLVHLDEFADLVTLNVIMNELQKGISSDMTIQISKITIRGSSLKGRINHLKRELDQIIKELGDITIRLEYVEKGKEGDSPKFIIGVASPKSEIVARAALIASEFLLQYSTENRGKT